MYCWLLFFLAERCRRSLSKGVLFYCTSFWNLQGEHNLFSLKKNIFFAPFVYFQKLHFLIELTCFILAYIFILLVLFIAVYFFSLRLLFLSDYIDVANFIIEVICKNTNNKNEKNQRERIRICAPLVHPYFIIFIRISS